jgi:glycerophosphoryl diester phosphodiesterase
LAGLRIAARLGVRAVEFDVMLSADGSPWLLHDETLERTTDGFGRVAKPTMRNCATSTPALTSIRLSPASRCRRWNRQRPRVVSSVCWPTSRSSRQPVSRR